MRIGCRPKNLDRQRSFVFFCRSVLLQNYYYKIIFKLLEIITRFYYFFRFIQNLSDQNNISNLNINEEITYMTVLAYMSEKAGLFR